MITQLNLSDHLWLRIMHTTNCLVALKARLDGMIDKAKQKGQNIDEQQYLVDRLDSAVEFIHLLMEDNRKMREVLRKHNLLEKDNIPEMLNSKILLKTD